MNCVICGAQASWDVSGSGVAGGLSYCPACLPDHFRPLIGSRVLPVIPEASVDAPADSDSPEPRKKNRNKARANS